MAVPDQSRAACCKPPTQTAQIARQRSDNGTVLEIVKSGMMDEGY